MSLRTIYSNVATLVAQGAAIEVEPGYVLKADLFLPPLMRAIANFRDVELPWHRPRPVVASYGRAKDQAQVDRPRSRPLSRMSMPSPPIGGLAA